SMPSGIGMLATAGVVVNANLVLIDCINKLRAAGADMEAAVRQAARERLRPILLTTITTFFGLMPILMEPSTSAAALKPVVVSLSFGVVFATGITLLMVPAMYLVFETLKARLGFGARAEVVVQGATERSSSRRQGSRKTTATHTVSVAGSVHSTRWRRWAGRRIWSPGRSCTGSTSPSMARAAAPLTSSTHSCSS